ncbi:DUF2268 domain-containing putative Zn-dependent protease [Deinococcus maricopensis]|uniref:DUF2268 domain-containing protein n=1 Tax=Deinococcus maricopensis (strain DSM 21211 / LMG 22137 / NRRL B-23946 / LB-34) TaxID=709986 RepID=E8UBI1_DEIML|nr:DUF2268 domain-containing putative Zn-dependent protease [Deinococcus maricopensis]ADV68420.1 Protein of unknown function DUF2268, Zn-dependent protease-related protein [Deinococcus maricopensis DSM 21211]
MPNALHLMNAGGLLEAPLEAALRAAATEALHRHAEHLALDGVDVAMYVSERTIPETGVLGYAPFGHYVEVMLSPDNANFERLWRTEVPATLAHELHHARRWRGPGYGHTLLEALVSEGLAQHHEATERGHAPMYACIHADLESLWAQAQEGLHRPHDHAAWFFGTAHLPRWAGYALGYELVRRYFQQHGGNAVTHVDAPAGRFSACWA